MSQNKKIKHSGSSAIAEVKKAALCAFMLHSLTSELYAKTIKQHPLPGPSREITGQGHITKMRVIFSQRRATAVLHIGIRVQAKSLRR